MKIKTTMLLCLWGFFALQAAQAQLVQISGVVTDGETGEELPGVSILIKGTTTGTTTDVFGNFKLQAQPEDVLQISYIGYETQELTVGNQTTINIGLRPDIEQLEEVVVVGYGTKKKRDIIGSVATVNSEDLVQMPTTSFDAGLQGLATGVQVTQSSGVPGAPVSIKIRGVNSITAGTDPLWIIDGMPVYSGGGLERTQGSVGQSPFSLINPNDIASIEVLKDAAATAIYGSRGSNGVIIITTKSGKKGKGSTTVDFSAGISDLVRTAEDIGFTNTTEWFGLVEQARRNSSRTQANPNGEFTPFDPFSITAFFRDNPTYHLTRQQALQVNTNWFDEILRTGDYQEVNVSTTQGFDKGQFYLSANYRDDESVLKNNRFQRFSGRLNVDFEPVTNLQVGARLNFAYTRNDRQKTQSGGATGSNGGGSVGGFGQANRGALPWFPIFNSAHSSGYWNPMSGSNLVANIDRDLMLDVVDQYRAIGGIFFDYKIPGVEGLSVRSELSLDFIQNNSVFWIADVLRELGSYASDRAATRQSYNYNVYATYSKSFGEDHEILAVAGTESQGISQYTRNMEGQNLTGTYQQLGTPQDQLVMNAGLGSEEYLRAFFGRADYKFKDRYLVGVSLRQDGSSKFQSEFRWGTFTAFSAGWIVSEEPFFPQTPIISLMKLRASFGQTGNKNIPNNLTETTYRNDVDWRYGTNDLIAAGTRLTNIGVPSLTWETTNSYDVGLDFGMFKNRLNGSIAYYMQDVTDLLLASPLAPSAGVQGGRIWGNIGDMRNYGLEFEISSINIDKNNFRWSTDFNFSTNDNEVLRLTPDVDRAGGGLIRGSTISRTGGRLNAYFMAEDAGVDPERGVNMIWEIDIERYENTGETVKTGRKIPATLANLRNHRIIHENFTDNPRWFGGINNRFEYKGFDLSVMVSFAGGNYIYDYELQRTTDVQYGQVVLRREMIGNTWTPENPNAKYPEMRWQGFYDWGWDPDIPNPEWDGDPDDPRATGYWIGGEPGDGLGNYKNETVNWTKYLFKGDFVRLRNVQFGYNLPSRIVEKLKFNGLRVYVSGTNLFTWTPEYESWDPETGGSSLPLLKMYSAGINAKF